MESVASKLTTTVKAGMKKFTDKVSDYSDNKEVAESSMNHVANSGRHVKTGWLRKQGGMVKSWHRRWFVLNGDCLFYFAKEDDLRPLGTIYLPGNKVTQHPANPDEPDKFLLEIIPESYAMTRSKSLSYKSKVPQKMAPNHETFLLCAASDDERQDWIKAIRKIMFSSVGGAIFGNRLEETMQYEKSHSNRKVPYLVESCVEFLTKHGLECEGLFRLPGRMLLVRDMKDRFDEGETVDLEEDMDVHSVASLLKQYLRELPECLIPFKLYQEFMNIAMRFQGNKNNEDKLENVTALRNAMTDLPLDNYNLLKYLCGFLHNVAANTHINKMTPLNLATVFGPNIIRHPNMDDNPEQFMLATADISQQLAYMFIYYFDQIFTIDYDSGRKSVQVAVDDLLNLGDDPFVTDSLLQPQPAKPTIAAKPPQNSRMNELSEIRFEQRADRRARSFQIDQAVLMDNIEDSVSEKKGKMNLDLANSFAQNATIQSPRSAETSPVTSKQLCFTEDGKPIPPIRRKYKRQHKALQGTNSVESVSSEQSGSESLNSTDENSVDGIDGAKSTLVIDLQQKLDIMTTDFNTLKTKYDNVVASKAKSDERLRELSSENSRIQMRYEEHIKNIEARHKSQYEDMCKKLNDHKTSEAEAVKKIMDLQKTLHRYQLQYGDISKQLPPLYQ